MQEKGLSSALFGMTTRLLQTRAAAALARGFRAPPTVRLLSMTQEATGPAH